MSRSDNTPITIPDEVLHQQLDAETVLLHLTTENYYGLDEVGSRVWQLLQEHGTTEPVVAAIVQEYDVDEATVRGDVDRLLGELADAGLIRRARGSGA